MFFSKRRELKEKERLEKEEALKKEQEIEAKIRIRKTLSSMKSQSAKLEKFKQDYITKAKKATLVGDTKTAELAKSGLKLCLSRQKVVDTMIANFEITMQINDMNKIVGNFVDGINVISEQMKNVTSGVDISKAQMAFEKAVANNEGQYQALDAFLESASDSIQSFDGIDSNVTDDEINALINNDAINDSANIDREIEAKINEIQAKLSN